MGATPGTPNVSMPNTTAVVIDGKVHLFPKDATDQEIAQATGKRGLQSHHFPDNASGEEITNALIPSQNSSSQQSAPTDFSAPPNNTEGIYKMNGPQGQIGVPYSKVAAAKQAGHVLDKSDVLRYNKDAGSGWLATQGDYLNSTTQHEPAPTTGMRSFSPAHMGQEFVAHAADAIKSVPHMFESGPDPTVGMTPEQRLQYRANAFAGQGEQQVKDFAADPGGSYAGHVGENFPGLAAGALGGEIVGSIAKKGKSLVTGGTKAAAALNDATLADNAAATDSAAAANAKAQSARTKQLNDHFQAIQQAKGEAPTTVGTLPDSEGAPRPMNARELQSHKEALNAGVQQLDQQFKSDLISTAKDAKTQLDNKYDTVRTALDAKTDPDTGDITPAPTVASPELALAVGNAEAKLMGSSENIKQFRDILAKHPESDPDFVKYEGAQIPRGHPLYDLIRENSETPSGATFRDLQGYYSELGDKLSSGGLQGDVYQAMKSLHDDIGGMMKKMAADNGVGNQLADAQDYARNYYADWRDPVSPLNRAIKTKEIAKGAEPGLEAVPGSIGQFQGKDQSGIGTLAKYNPELAKRANTIRGYQQQAKSISSAPFVEKPVSALAPSTPPVQPEIKTIGPEDIQAANAAKLADRAQGARKLGSSKIASGIAALDAVQSAMSGNWKRLGIDVGSRLGLAATTYGYAKLLEIPTVAEYITRPTPTQVAAIDPSIARDLQPIVEQAKQKGIKVSPALTAAISAHATKDKWWDRPNP